MKNNWGKSTSYLKEAKGESLDQATRAKMEALLGHNLGDIRIHQTKQAGEIARRLGAEAFTIGNQIFAEEGALTSPQKISSGLLAHEITHVVQQIRPMPLPLAAQKSIPGGLAISSTLSNSPGDSDSAQTHVLQMNSSGSGRGGGNTSASVMEKEANSVEQMVRRIVEKGEKTAVTRINVEELADFVHRLMQADLLIEKDRVRR